MSYDAIDEEDMIGDSRDTSKEGDQGKKGGEPRIPQCPLEEREDGDWEIDNEYLEENWLIELKGVSILTRRIPYARTRRRYASGSLSYHIPFLLLERIRTMKCPATAHANADRTRKSTAKNTDINAFPVGMPSEFTKVGIPGEIVSLLLMIVAGSTNNRRSKARLSNL